MKAFQRLLVLFFGAELAHSCTAGTLVAFHLFLGTPAQSTYFGDIDVELYDKDKPVTVSNFLALVNSGAYKNSFFHRIATQFVLQGGGYTAIDVTSTNVIGPPYTNTLKIVPSFGNIPDELNAGTFRSNIFGTIAMAKSGAPNTANTQFFFNIANNSTSLDTTNNAGGFTVFGHVISGSAILTDFNGLFYGDGIFDLTQSYGATGISTAFTQLPAYFPGTNPPPYNSLFYYTISTLSAQVEVATNNAVQISWLSVAGLTNRLEYSTNLPPTWNVLASAVGDGTTTFVATDPTTNKSRFYRIHILY